MERDDVEARIPRFVEEIVNFLEEKCPGEDMVRVDCFDVFKLTEEGKSVVLSGSLEVCSEVVNVLGIEFFIRLDDETIDEYVFVVCWEFEPSAAANEL